MLVSTTLKQIMIMRILRYGALTTPGLEDRLKMGTDDSLIYGKTISSSIIGNCNRLEAKGWLASKPTKINKRKTRKWRTTAKGRLVLKVIETLL